MNQPQRRLAESIIATLRREGFQAYLVGGCVRDLLLGIDPKDYDVATDARPETVLELFPRSERVGAHFGVILVKGGGSYVEVATFRSDHEYHDGRRPERVTFETDPRKDVLRRDFTINALLLDPASGDVYDYVGGRDDLKAGIIRAIGDPESRFHEDRLRMIRAIRFAARFRFSIHPGTMAAIQKLHKLIHSVSAERIRDELLRILTEGGAKCGFELLDESLLLPEILPEIAAMKGVQQPPEYHPEGDVWIHTLIMLDTMQNPTPEQALGVLLHDVGKPPTFRIADRIRFDGHAEVGTKMAHQILTRLRFPNESIRQVEALVANHMKFKDVTNMRESTLKRFMRLDKFNEHLELHRLDCLGGKGDLSNYDFVRCKLEGCSQETLRPEPLLTGADLIEAGYQPGPMFKEMLQAAEDAQLEGLIHTREDALELVMQRFQPAQTKS